MKYYVASKFSRHHNSFKIMDNTENHLNGDKPLPPIRNGVCSIEYEEIKFTEDNVQVPDEKGNVEIPKTIPENSSEYEDISSVNNTSPVSLETPTKPNKNDRPVESRSHIKEEPHVYAEVIVSNGQKVTKHFSVLANNKV
jgi:hypothetical protein